MSKVPIKIEISAKEDAITYYEKTMGSNITIQKRATVLYYASKGAESITELHKSCGYTRVFIRATLNGYWEKGIEYIYECSRGIKQSAFNSIENELLEEFQKNPPSYFNTTYLKIKV